MTKFQQRIYDALMALGGIASDAAIAEVIKSHAGWVMCAARRLKEFVDLRIEEVNGQPIVMLYALKPKED